MTSNSLPNCDAVEPGFCGRKSRPKSTMLATTLAISRDSGCFLSVSGRICYCACGAGWTRPGLVLDAEGQPLPFALAEGEAVLAAGLSLDFEPVILEHVGMPPPQRFDNMVLIGYRADGCALSRVVHADTRSSPGTAACCPPAVSSEATGWYRRTARRSPSTG